MIVATAGHVDHGKTTLIKSLTGMDTTHLPEERKRGMTIDLGFAGLATTDGGHIGFVDVPGHERFVRNMLAGITGVDLALLIVAADDGIMPQTEEHLEILDLLRVKDCAVAVTKIDRVDAARVAQVAASVAQLLSTTHMAGAPIFPVSTPESIGIDTLRDHLLARAQCFAAQRPGAHVRLPIDRSFVLEGAGLIVTGTIASGRVTVGDHLVVVPGGAEIRVRAVHSHRLAVDSLGPGQRCALNIVAPNLERAQLARGAWIVAAPIAVTTRHIDARLAQARGRVLKDGARIHFCHGAASTGGHLVTLPNAVTPAYVQLVLDAPVHALARDAFILRHRGGEETLAGGIVLDPFPQVRGRRKQERIARLAALDQSDAAHALSTLLPIATEGVDVRPFAQAWNLDSATANRLFAGAQITRYEDVVYDSDMWRLGRERLVTEVTRFHQVHPDSYGPTAAQLLHFEGTAGTTRCQQTLLASLIHDKQLIRDGAHLRRPTHDISLSPPEKLIWRQIAPLLGPKRRPMTVHDIAAHGKLDFKTVTRVLQRAARADYLVRISTGRYLHKSAFLDNAVKVEALAADRTDGLFDAAAFRDRTDLGRTVSIELLEYFDRIGFTQRIGNQRRVLKPAAAVSKTR